MFVKYQHIEKYGTSETEGIENGTCYVFPKIDGTNSSMWYEKGVSCFGNRLRQLSLEEDNAGFMIWGIKQQQFEHFFKTYPSMRLYGEWLVPHSLKTYRKNAWRDFYVFDVCLANLDEDNRKHICYDDYQKMLEDYGINYIPPIKIIRNADYETLIKQLELNNFLIEDGKGIGEGIVIKNYDYANRYGRQTWAKIVTSEFKETHNKVMGAPIMDGKTLVEDSIINDYCTEYLIKKTYCKIKIENEGWLSKFIPELLGRTWHDLISEECWNFVKKNKNSTINFKTLQYKMNIKIKETLPEIF
jgi:hypothetical protein